VAGLELQRDDLEVVNQSLRDELGRMFKVVVTLTLNKNISDSQFEMEKILLGFTSQTKEISEKVPDEETLPRYSADTNLTPVLRSSPAEFSRRLHNIRDTSNFENTLNRDSVRRLSFKNIARSPTSIKKQKF
jgi:hypothetical protein